MLFTSFVFLQIFLPVVLVMDRLLRNIQLKNIFLLIVSLIFYAWGEPRNIFFLLISLVVNYLIGRYGLAFSNSDKVRKIFLSLGLIYNLSILVIFKYTSPLMVFLDDMFHFPFEYSIILLPLGISFFTFQTMSYLMDTYRKENEPQKNCFKLSLYIMLFPQLVAGPIVKYHDIAQSLDKRTVTLQEYAGGIRRFVLGLGKKVLVANQMAYLADDVFMVPIDVLDCKTAWMGIIAYTLQIYFDFSGYSDMAIGLGRMLGFHFKENFNLPYTAKSIQEFWRRWHISLSTWFKEYLYIPLGGSRVSEKRTYLNILIVFAATGIWHGAGLNFIVWGLYYGVLLMFERWKLKKFLDKPEFYIPARVYTLLAVMVGWVFFRAENLCDAWGYCRAMFSFGNNPELLLGDFVSPLLGALMLIAAAVAMPVRALKILGEDPENMTIKWYDCLWAAIILAASLMMLAGNTYNPFIYFRF